MRNESFYNLVKDAKKLKKEYKSYLHPKYTDDDKVRKLKQKVYSIKIIEWKLDMVWMYITSDITYGEMLEFLKINKP